jgi:sulfite exporter TauE/SafE/copper chaperone CopZ
MSQPTSTITSVFYIQGLHCPSCEILIEKRLIKEKTVEMVDVSLSKNRLRLEHQPNDHITPAYLNRLFAADGYRFSLKPFNHSTPVADGQCSISSNLSSGSLFTSLLIALTLIVGYLLLSHSGLSSLVSVDSQSSLPLFFFFGLLAGFSSCAALVGGIILSLGRQWLSLSPTNSSTLKKSQPHLLFNLGRILGYVIFGAILGGLGSFFQLSPVFTATLVIAISLLMAILGFQMLGVKALKNFQVALPKFITHRISDESNFQSSLGPLLMGALTFFLPCGFTITAQALALSSGSPLQGALIMGLFALGTIPGLLAIGLSSVKFHANPQTSKQFSVIAGVLVLFFAIVNINSQLNVLGVSSLSNLVSASSTFPPETSGLPPLVNGTQVVKITASSYAYTPNLIKLRANTPTRWEIKDGGFSGCTSAIVSRGLFDGQIDLVRNGTATKEFTSPQSGVYKFSCFMGMVSGTVEVVDSSGSTGVNANAQPVDSGAGGCGCGGGGSTCGGP